MDTDADDRFWDALARWEELYQQGTDAPPEDLCRSHPENTERLRQHIQALKRMAWLTKPATDQADIAQSQGSDSGTPRRLGEYDLLEPIGAGGMGQVFKAIHRRMDRVVAVKILPRVSPDSSRRFQEEVRAAGKLLHPNIVTSFDAGEQDGVPFLAMEFIDGIDLAQQVQKHGRVPVKLAVNLIVQAARGLEYAHGQGVIHRDVKPSNLFLSKGGTLKILDLGLAQLNGEKRTIAGTSDYLPPEFVATGQADHRGDIYSLGCTLFFLLTGKPPFTGRTVIQTVMAHCEQPTPSLKTARSDVPAALDAVFQRMIAKRPQDRCQSMAEVIAALERCLRGRRRAKWLVFAGFVGSVVVAAGLRNILTNGPAAPTATEQHAVLPVGKSTEPFKMATQPNGEQPKLQTWNLDGRATDADLEMFRTMPDLGVLRLNRCKITDKGLECLSNCTTLRHLELNHTPIGDAGLRHLQNLTEMRHLGLSGTAVQDQGLRHLKAMKQLQHLNLDYTKVGDDGLEHVAGLPSLTDLRLTETKISDAGLAALRGLMGLRKIDLHGTAITDEGFDHLLRLADLREVGLTRTGVSVAAERRFQESRK